MGNTKEQIKILYFQKHFKIVEIAEELNISKQRVSKVLNTDFKEDFILAKEYRKEVNKQKRNKLKSDKNKQRRKLFEGDITADDLRIQQESAARCLSKRGHMSNESAVYSNINAYRSTGKSLVYNSALGARPADLPKSLSLYINFNN